jgi:hypothetical protein
MAAPVHIRHVRNWIRDPATRLWRRAISTDLGAVGAMGAYFVPDDRRGVNGSQGFQQGMLERRLLEEGSFAISLPNDVGSDGLHHLDRFTILAEQAGYDYKAGDEWVEVYEGESPGGRLLFVGTPTRYQITKSKLTLQGYDGFWLLKRARESGAGFWRHAPRDVFEHYTGIWQARVAEDFSSGVGAITTNMTLTGGTLFMADQAAPPPPYFYAYPAGETVNLSVPTTPWRWECQLNNVNPVKNFLAIAGSTEGWLRFGLGGSAPTTTATGYGLTACCIDVKVHQNQPHEVWLIHGDGASTHLNEKVKTTFTSITHLAIEGRGEWVYYYVNGVLVGSSHIVGNMTAMVPSFVAWNGTAGPNPDHLSVNIESLTLRKRVSFLQQSSKGDLRLPGVPTPGGLYGRYYDVSDRPFTGVGANALNYLFLDQMTREPYATRIDKTIDFAPDALDPAQWVPKGTPGGDNVFVRWVGSVYLDLDNFDYAFRMINVDDRARLYVGKTVYGNALLDDIQGAGAAAHTLGPSNWVKAGNGGGGAPAGATGILTGQRSGWYPVVIECQINNGLSSIQFQYEKSNAVGTWTTVPSTELSPYGIVHDNNRYDSHYEAIKALGDTYGYQYTCEPRSLESGEFPGVLAPYVRVGRDTDYVLEEAASVEHQLEGNAEDLVTALYADGSGISDQKNAAQISVEVLDFSELASHFMVHEEYESLAEISELTLLLQRLSSLVALRSSPWEDTRSRPAQSKRELRDTFPLTGALAEFGWLPGDGLRLALPTLRIKDNTPRQILGTTWDYTPSGLKSPAASFKQRPKNLLLELRRLASQALNPQRNYQQQLTVCPGGVASYTVVSGFPTSSQVALPWQVAKVVSAEVIALSQAGTSSWTVLINGVSTGVALDASRTRVDITGYLARRTPEWPMVYAEMSKVGGGAGDSIIFQLVLTVAI